MQVHISQPGVAPTTYSLEGCQHTPPMNLAITLPWDPRDIDAITPAPGQNAPAPGKTPKLSDLDIFKYAGEHVKSAIDSCPALTELLTKVIDFFKKHAALPDPDSIGPLEHEEHDSPTPETPPAPGKTDPAAPVAENPEGLAPGNERKVSFVNDGDKPMTLRFTPNAGNAEIPDMVIPPGEGRTVQFPEGWGGNVRSTKGDGPATLVELKFDQDKTWGDVSHIDGSNAYATIATVGGETKTGTRENLLEGAPESLILRDANGQPYGIKPSTVAENIDPAVVDYLSERLPPGQGYKYPTDDLSTTAFGQSNLVVHMRDYS